MTHDEVNKLRIGDVIEYSPAGCQAQWTVHDIARRRDGSALSILACINDLAQPASINITKAPEHWTFIERAKQPVHPLEQLQQRLQ